jgi:prolyl-tRNA synthetase
VCIDDRDLSPGNKFGDAELIGIPYQIILSDRVLEQGENMVELINRKTGDRIVVPFSEII